MGGKGILALTSSHIFASSSHMHFPCLDWAVDYSYSHGQDPAGADFVAYYFRHMGDRCGDVNPCVHATKWCGSYESTSYRDKRFELGQFSSLYLSHSPSRCYRGLLRLNDHPIDDSDSSIFCGDS